MTDRGESAGGVDKAQLRRRYLETGSESAADSTQPPLTDVEREAILDILAECIPDRAIDREILMRLMAAYTLGPPDEQPDAWRRLHLRLAARWPLLQERLGDLGEFYLRSHGAPELSNTALTYPPAYMPASMSSIPPAGRSPVSPSPDAAQAGKAPPRSPDPKLISVREDRGPRTIPLPGFLKRLAALL